MSFQHVALMRFPHTLTPGDLAAMDDVIRAWPQAIGGIESLAWGTDVSGRAQGCQFGIVVRFRDEAAAQAYQDHPRHQALVHWIREHAGEVQAFDFPILDREPPRAEGREAGGGAAVVGWGPVLLFAERFAECRAFYEGGLGLVPATERPGYVEYVVGAVTLALHATDHRRAGPGPVALHLYVDDVHAMATQLTDAGFPPPGPVAQQPWGRELSVMDPDGFQFDLLEKA